MKKGKYISLFQIDENDGYGHDMVEIKNYRINDITYSTQEKLVKILFNSSPILNKIGITEKEISKSILKELRVIFLLPCILGVSTRMYIICLEFSFMGINGKYGVGYSMLVGIIYVVLEMMFYALYNKKYIKKIMNYG